MQKVLVLDANQRSSLAIIRSLGRRGLKVVAGDHIPQTLGAASRYAAASVLYPDPSKSATAFVTAIRSIVQQIEADTVVPTTDLTTMLLAGHSGLLNGARLACPQEASYEALTDKARLLELARQLEVPAPETHIVRTPNEIEKAARDLGYPLVLKPARSRYLSGDKVISTSVSTVSSPKQLSETLGRLNWLEQIPCLVQRFVDGHGAGIFSLCGPGGSIAWFAHRRVREKPPTGGVSVLSESVPLDSAMQLAAGKLLAAVDWLGVAMIEFRIARDGKPHLMEVNGRFWGSLQLAIDCGVDFPWLLYQLTRGQPVVPSNSYALRHRLRWLLGDLDSLILDLRQSKTGAALKARAVIAFLYAFVDPRCRQEIFRISDPGPALQEARHWIGDLRGIRLR